MRVANQDEVEVRIVADRSSIVFRKYYSRLTYGYSPAEVEKDIIDFVEHWNSPLMKALR